MKDQSLALPVAQRWPEEPVRLVPTSAGEAPKGWRRLWRGFYEFLYDFNRY